MKKIKHGKHKGCYKLTDEQDINFAAIAQGATVRKTILPSGTETPDKNLAVQGKYLVPAK